MDLWIFCVGASGLAGSGIAQICVLKRKCCYICFQRWLVGFGGYEQSLVRTGVVVEKAGLLGLGIPSLGLEHLWQKSACGDVYLLFLNYASSEYVMLGRGAAAWLFSPTS